jgi:hypothetical protein
MVAKLIARGIRTILDEMGYVLWKKDFLQYGISVYADIDRLNRAMKIDFSAVIKDLEGDAVKDGEKDATLGRVACAALLASYADEQNLPAEDKVKRFHLAEVAAKGGEQEMKIDDVALIKTLIGKAFAPLVVGRAYDIIEPSSA